MLLPPMLLIICLDVNFNLISYNFIITLAILFLNRSNIIPNIVTTSTPKYYYDLLSNYLIIDNNIITAAEQIWLPTTDDIY